MNLTILPLAITMMAGPQIMKLSEKSQEGSRACVLGGIKGDEMGFVGLVLTTHGSQKGAYPEFSDSFSR
jgi:hypothetical protein